MQLDYRLVCWVPRRCRYQIHELIMQCRSDTKGVNHVDYYPHPDKYACPFLIAVFLVAIR